MNQDPIIILRWGIITLVALVELFSNVCFQMCPQSTWVWACIITSVAFVWLFSTVCFQMNPQIAWPKGLKVTLVAFFHSAFSDVSSKHLDQSMLSHTGCMHSFSKPLWNQHFLFVIHFKLSQYFVKQNSCWSSVTLSMYSKALFALKCFAATMAKESLLLSVGHCMAVQITRWNKTVRTFATLVWLFSSVCTSHVNCQLASWGAWKVTLWTFVGLFPRVSHLVLWKGVFSIWGKVALGTLMGLFPRVSHLGSPHMIQLKWRISDEAFPQCASYVSLDHYLECMSICIVHTWATSPRMGEHVPLWCCICCIAHTCVSFVQNGWTITNSISTEILIEWFLWNFNRDFWKWKTIVFGQSRMFLLVLKASAVRFQILLQIACLRRCIITLEVVTYVQLFSSVCFQMCPQNVCPRGCIITLVASYDFSPLCTFKCVLKALAWEDAKWHWFDFSPLCLLKRSLKEPALEDAKSHWLHLFDFSPLWIFKCVLKLPAWEDEKSHWLHLFNFCLLCVFKCVLK